jgi:hypothetical protein
MLASSDGDPFMNGMIYAGNQVGLPGPELKSHTYLALPACTQINK